MALLTFLRRRCAAPAILAALPLCTLLCALPAGQARAADLVVIVSARSQVTALRPDQVAAIFLGQLARFPDGAEAVPLDQRVGSPLRDEFYARVTAKTPALLKAYWSKMVFTGRGQPPAELPDSTAVKRKIADNPELIGYIDRSALDGSVRPVLTVQ
jgi:ABC-type phosphate transport system substrate-binding protein